MELPKDIDKECLLLCEELNKLDGVETTESCCGHLKSPYNIFICCKSFTSLAIIARAIDERYCGTKYVWKLVVETSDDKPCFNFMLTSEIAYNTIEQMGEDVSKICENINYWKTNFYEYFDKNNE